MLSPEQIEADTAARAELVLALSEFANCTDIGNNAQGFVPTEANMQHILLNGTNEQMIFALDL